MIKREAEKETPEDLKQAFRVFDKVGEQVFWKFKYYLSGREWLCVNIWNKICFDKVRNYPSFLNYEIFDRLGLVFTDDELGEMVSEADIDGDQHVSFEEFRDIFNEG